MAFVDEARIYAESGKGGDGVIRWLRTKESARGGPSGGDGGGAVLHDVRDIAALAHYRYEKKFHAEDGEAGKSELKHGKNGEDMLLKVPVGTVARIVQTGEESEITKEE